MKLKQINLKTERIKIQNQLNKRLPSVKLRKYTRNQIFTSLFNAEMNGLEYRNHEKNEVIHDSKRNAALYQKRIIAAIESDQKTIIDRIYFDIMNEKIKTHYEIESLKERLKEKEIESKRWEQRYYESFRNLKV